MTKKTEEKVISILKNLYNVVLAEENGSAEHVCEWFDSEEIESLIEEVGGKIQSNLTEHEIEEVVDDFISDYDVTCYNEGQASKFVNGTDLNKAAKEQFHEALKKRFA